MEFNLIVVLDWKRQHVLMCRRQKQPYQGLLNFVGGKIEPGEEHAAAAYRELLEETAIPADSLTLSHVMDLTYPLEASSIEVYTGVLQKSIAVHGDENELLWIPVDADFADIARFAGYGNIHHIMSYILKHQRSML